MDNPKLRVWHIPQVPGQIFAVPVESVREAAKVLYMLAYYDQFQYQNKIKPDFCNASGLEEFDEEAKIWREWHDEETDMDIKAILYDEKEALTISLKKFSEGILKESNIKF